MKEFTNHYHDLVSLIFSGKLSFLETIWVVLLLFAMAAFLSFIMKVATGGFDPSIKSIFGRFFKKGNVSKPNMHCTQCGTVLGIDDKFCSKCGAAIPSIATSNQAAPPLLPPAAPVEPRYKGVGGWLLLFCLGLSVFSPLITLGSLVASYSESSQYFDRFPGLLATIVIDTFLCVGLMVFSIYAGVGLWRTRPGAVQTAKRYLLWSLAYYAVAAVLPFMAGLPSQANDAMMAEVVKETVRGVVYFAIWYSYLNKSERVKATYET